MRTKQIRAYLLSCLATALLLSGCYKEDTSTLYSRQVVIAASLKDLNDKIKVINGDIVELKNLYNILNNKPVATNLTYVTNEAGDTIGVNVTISGTEFYIPYGVKGKDGQDGKDGVDGKDGKDGVNPTISISNDGYWVINGEKTTHKAIGQDGKDGVNGQDGADGQNGQDGGVPIISAKQDLSNLDDQHFYWTIKYPGETTDSFLLVNGQKVRATPKDGVDGKDGATGPQGPQGPQGQPGVESFVTNIEQENDQITITTINGDTFVVPLREIAFKLKTEGKVDADGILQFSMHDQEIVIPYTSSDNLASIRSTLPTGWSAEPVISNDPTQRVVRIRAPKLIDLDRASFEGDVVFYGLDEKGMVITQFTKVKLQRYLYLSYFYNPLDAVELGRPNSPFNQLKLPATPVKMEQVFYELQESAYRQVRHEIHGTGTTKDNLSTTLFQYPSYLFPKDYLDTDKSYKVVTAIYNPDSVDRKELVNIQGQPESFVYQVKKYDNSDMYRPVPYDTYMVQYSYAQNSGSNVELIRLKRASAKVNVYVKNYISFLKLDSMAFDLEKVKIRMTQTVGTLNSSYKSTDTGTTEVTSKMGHIQYDVTTGQLTASFGVLGVANGAWTIELWYDDVKKCTWRFQAGTSDIVVPDNIVSTYINFIQRPFPAGPIMSNYVGITRTNLPKTAYVEGYVIIHK